MRMHSGDFASSSKISVFTTACSSTPSASLDARVPPRGSHALTADGWHMGTHVGALGLTLAAYWYARTRAANDSFSFGTGKVYALAGYTSGVLLSIVAVWMAVEGVVHLAEHPDVRYAEA